ncbi:MAG: HAD family hydrolase [Bacteroidota bacterium]|nr:HAD family hydrolase [Bacteroidota bacterium]
MNYSAIIFDLDGTLLNTLDDLANSMNFVLKQHRFPEHPVENYKMFVGNGMEKLVKRVLPSVCEDELFMQSFLDEFKKQYDLKWHDCTVPYPGIIELIDNLHTLGIKMSVLSNKPDHFTQVIIDYFFGLNRFECVYGARAGVPKKPDPTAALEVAHRSDIQPSDYLYLGDSGVDMQTANAAGMYALGATWGFREADELKANGAQKLIYDPNEIIELVRNSIR